MLIVNIEIKLLLAAVISPSFTLSQGTNATDTENTDIALRHVSIAAPTTQFSHLRINKVYSIIFEQKINNLIHVIIFFSVRSQFEPDFYVFRFIWNWILIK